MRKAKRNSFTEPRKVLFPDVKRLDELFGAIVKEKHLSPPPDLWFGVEGAAHIGPYCAASGRKLAHQSLYVRARAHVVEAIKSHTINCGSRDHMHFEIILREKDALVTCSHGIIIGSVWLAKVSLKEARKYLTEE